MLRSALIPVSRMYNRLFRTVVSTNRQIKSTDALYRCLQTSTVLRHESPPEKASPIHGSGEFNEKLLEILVCPLSKAPLRYDKKNKELICDQLQVAYPIVNGVPNLIPNCGRKIDQ